MTLTRRAALALPFAAGPAFAQSCLPVASVPLHLVEGYPIVAATVLGQPLSFVLDTGAQAMLVTPAVADTLALPLRGITRVFGTGGSDQARVVALPDLRLGGVSMGELLAPVSALPVTLTTAFPLAGLLGAALLSRFDVLVDVPGGRLALFLPGSCPPPPGRAVPLQLSSAAEAFVAVTVNGVSTLALLDTGSRATLLNAPFARRLRLAAPVSANTARGVDGERMSLEHAQVSLSVAGAPAMPAPVSITPLQLDRGDMLLGLDQLGRHPFWIGYGSACLVLL